MSKVLEFKKPVKAAEPAVSAEKTETENDVLSFEELAEKNRKNQERLANERLRANKTLVRTLVLKK